jgi:hypothetical protein
VRERDHAVHAGEVVQPVLELPRDQLCDGRRAVHARNHADVVARRDSSVGADDALKSRRRVDVLRRFDVGAERVVAFEVTHRDVVDVDVIACFDVPRREPMIWLMADRRTRATSLTAILWPGGTRTAVRTPSRSSIVPRGCRSAPTPRRRRG